MTRPTEYHAGKRTEVTVKLVNPDTRRWEIEVVSHSKVGLWRRAHEVPDWQLDDMVRLCLGGKPDEARRLVNQIRRDWPTVDSSGS